MTQIVNGRIKLPAKLGGDKFDASRLQRLIHSLKPKGSILDKFKIDKYTHSLIKDPIKDPIKGDGGTGVVPIKDPDFDFFPDKMPDKVISSGGGVQTDCCEQLYELEQDLNFLQQQNANLMTQLGSGVGGLGFFENQILVDPEYSAGYALQAMSFQDLSSSYTCLYNNYITLYDAFISATDKCMDELGSGFFDTMTLTFQPVNPVTGSWGQSLNDPQTYQDNITTPEGWITVPFDPQQFNPNNLTCNNGVTSTMDTYIQGLLQIIAANPNGNITITYSGEDPVAANLMYANLIAELQFNLQVYEQQYGVLYAENQEYQELFGNMQQLIFDLTDQLAEAQANGEALQVQLDDLQILFDIVNDGITQETLDLTIEYWEQQLITAQTATQNLQDLYDSVFAQLGEAATLNLELQVTLQDTENSLLIAELDLQYVQQQLQDLVLLYQEMEAGYLQQITDLGVENLLLSEQVENLLTELANLELQNATLNDLNGTLQDANDLLTEANADLLVVQGQLQGLLEDEQIENAELEILLVNLQNAYNNLNTQYQIALLSLETAEGYLQQAADIIEQLEGEVDAGNITIDGLQQDLSNLQTQIDTEYVPLAEYNNLLEQFDIVNDGITQETLDNALADAEAAWNESMNSLQEEYNEALQNLQNLLDAANVDLAAAMANQEDGVSQADVDAAVALVEAFYENYVEDDGVYQSDLDALQEALDTANAANTQGVAQLQSLLDQANSDLAAANAANAILQTENDSLGTQLDIAMANQEDGVSQTDVDAAVAQAAAQCQTQLDSLQALLDAANANQEDGIGQEQIDAITDAMQNEIDLLQDLLDVESGLTESQLETINNLNSEISQLQNDFAQLQAQLDVANANQEDGIGQADVDAVQTLLNNAYDTIDNLTDEVDQLNAEIQDYQEQSYDDSQEYMNLLNTYNDLASSNAELQSNYNDLQNQLDIANANQEDGISQADVDAIQNLLTASELNAQILQAQLSDVQTQLFNLQNDTSDTDALQAIIDDLNIQIGNLQNQVEYYDDGVTQADLAGAQATIDQLQNELNNIVPDDGVGQVQVDAAYNQGYSAGSAIVIQDYLADLPVQQGYSAYIQYHYNLIVSDPAQFCADNGIYPCGGEGAINPNNEPEYRMLRKAIADIGAYAQQLEGQLGIRPSKLDSIKPGGLNNGLIKPTSTTIKPIKNRR